MAEYTQTHVGEGQFDPVAYLAGQGFTLTPEEKAKLRGGTTPDWNVGTNTKLIGQIPEEFDDGGQLLWNEDTEEFGWIDFSSKNEEGLYDVVVMTKEAGIQKQLDSITNKAINPNFSLEPEFEGYTLGPTGFSPPQKAPQKAPATVADGNGTAMSQFAADPEAMRKAQQQRTAGYMGAMIAAEALGAAPTVWEGTKRGKSGFEESLEKTIEEGVQEMTPEEEADLARQTLGQAAAISRQQTFLGEAVQAAKGGVTSAREALQEKKASVQAMAEQAMRAGAVIAAEKKRVIQESLAKIQDAQAADYALKRERQEVIQNLGSQLSSIIGYYGGYAPAKTRSTLETVIAANPEMSSREALETANRIDAAGGSTFSQPPSPYNLPRGAI